MKEEFKTDEKTLNSAMEVGKEYKKALDLATEYIDFRIWGENGFSFSEKEDKKVTQILSKLNEEDETNRNFWRTVVYKIVSIILEHEKEVAEKRLKLIDIYKEKFNDAKGE